MTRMQKFWILAVRMVFWLAAICTLAGLKSIKDGTEIPEDLDTMLYIFVIFGVVFCLASVVIVASDIINMLKGSRLYKTISQLCIVFILLWLIWMDKWTGVAVLSTLLLLAIIYYADKKYYFLSKFKRG